MAMLNYQRVDLHFFQVGASHCLPCAPGNFSATAAAGCKQCPPGRYAAALGESSCRFCEESVAQHGST